MYAHVYVCICLPRRLTCNTKKSRPKFAREAKPAKALKVTSTLCMHARRPIIETLPSYWRLKLNVMTELYSIWKQQEYSLHEKSGDCLHLQLALHCASTKYNLRFTSNHSLIKFVIFIELTRVRCSNVIDTQYSPWTLIWQSPKTITTYQVMMDKQTQTSCLTRCTINSQPYSQLCPSSHKSNQLLLLS
jgi:hypothetical protein